MSIPQIIVFLWPGSPWASKVTSYLALRNIPYAECHQPITMPRPDLEALGVKYRRIPVVAINSDIVCDTLLILNALEKAIPANDNVKPTLGAQNGTDKAIEKLLEKWTDVVVFPRAAADTIPLDHPLVLDPKFIQDRTALWGDSWEPEARAKKRPEALVNMRECFDLLENTILSDGRRWVLGGDSPSLADIHGCWIFQWLVSLETAFPSSLISEKIYPRTYAWCDQYSKAVESVSGHHETIDGAEAIKRIGNTEVGEIFNLIVDENDPLGLKSGQLVSVAPIDTGSDGKETGKLIALNANEVVIDGQTKNGDHVRLHSPRWNFRVQPISNNGLSTN